MSAKKQVASLLFQNQLFWCLELERGKGMSTKVCASHSTGEDMSLCREDRVLLLETCVLELVLGFHAPALDGCIQPQIQLGNESQEGPLMKGCDVHKGLYVVSTYLYHFLSCFI